MAKVKVKTTGATINGQPIGSTMELEEAEAKRLEERGYVEIQKSAAGEDKPKESRKKKKDD
jgi:hypothetical protein